MTLDQLETWLDNDMSFLFELTADEKLTLYYITFNIYYYI